MNIACLGWGSLIWDPEPLPLMPNKPQWFKNGPELPVEFARQSANGRMTLVIVPPEMSKPRPVLWAHLRSHTIAEAHEALARREWGRGPLPQRWTAKDWIDWKDRNIARWTKLAGSSSGHAQQIATWADRKKLDGVVWTILPPRFKNTERVPTLHEAVNYLKGLKRVEKYIRNAPPDILTSYRAAIENALGWTCNRSATQNEIC